MVFTLFRGRSQFAQIRLPIWSQCTLSLSPGIPNAPFLSHLTIF